ncbi:MAG: peptide-binding protein [Candidatus Hydrogenedentes bacterium]|nr:peptide-binding protein [Candidatus Hydrogenedentota bacterium]
MMRRPHVYVITLCAMLALAGCGGPAPAPGGDTAPPETSVAGNSTVPADEGTPVDGDWVINLLPVEPQHLNPLLEGADAYTQRIGLDIFESLLDVDKDTFELKPMLAESYEISEDHLTYTFHMRKDAKFSDGVPVTAHDVKFTYDAIMNPSNETEERRSYIQDVTRAEVLDDYTIRFTCTKPYYLHLGALGNSMYAMCVLPKHIYEKNDFNTSPSNRHPVGSGPYAFESWETNQQIVLRRNDNYWNPAEKGHVDKIVYKIISDDNAAFQVLERQELDAVPLMPEQWVTRASTPQFEAKFDKLKYWGSTGYSYSFTYIGWNMRKPQLSDKRARQALTMLLNRDEVVETLFYGLAQVVTGATDPKTPESNPSIEPWPFDPERAKALLDEAGWTDHNSDGVRDKDGVEFTFELLYTPGLPVIDQMATFYQEELKRAGIRMNIRRIEWAAFLDSVQKRNFDAVVLSWAVPPNEDLYQIFHSTQTEKGSNYPGLVNAEVDKLLEDIRVEFDRDKRIPMFHRIDAILHEEQPYTFLYTRQALVAVDKRFRGVKVYNLGLDLSEWWVPKDQQRYSGQ